MKAFVTILFFPIITIVFADKTRNPNHYQNKYNKIEYLVLSRIKNLPEVKEYLGKNKTEKAALMIAREPDSVFKYYWIKLGVSNFDMFRTADDFYVDPKTLYIYYLDLMDSSGMTIVTLQQWRKWRSDPRFWKIHTFKAGKIIPIK